MKKYRSFDLKSYFNKSFLFSNWQLIIIFCSLLVISSIFVFYKTDIVFKIWEITNNEKAFIQYIEDNKKNDSKIEQVNTAIDLLSTINTDFGFASFEKIFTSEDTPRYLKNKLLEIYTINNNRKLDTEILYNDLLLGNLDSNMIIRLIERAPYGELESIVFNRIKNYALENKWDQMLTYIENHKIYELKEIEILESVFEELFLLRKESEELGLIDEEIDNIRSKISSIEKEHDNTITEVGNKKKKRDEALENFNIIENEYNMFFQDWVLDFYVIALINQADNINHYEICPARYDYYGNKYISMDRANLYTRDILYSTKGWASLWVVDGGKEQIRLKEDLGSFVQEWPVYIESSLFKDTIGKPIQEIYVSAKKEYLESEEEYVNSLKRRDDLKNSLENLSNDISDLMSKYEKSRELYLDKVIKSKDKIMERLNLSEIVNDEKSISREEREELNLYLNEIITGFESELDGVINNMPYNGLKFFKSYFVDICKKGLVDMNDEKTINILIKELESIIELYDDKKVHQTEKGIELTKKIQSVLETY